MKQLQMAYNVAQWERPLLPERLIELKHRINWVQQGLYEADSHLLGAWSTNTRNDAYMTDNGANTTAFSPGQLELHHGASGGPYWNELGSIDGGLQYWPKAECSEKEESNGEGEHS